MIVGTITCLIHTFLLIDFRYSKNNNVLLKFPQVKSLYFMEFIDFISSNTRSVYFSNSLILSFKTTPAVSNAVCKFLFFANLNNSKQKSGCNKGSPPLIVIPPFFIKL